MCPLSVHGVVLFSVPGGGVVHVDAAEYVHWLHVRHTTLSSQLTLCRESLRPELQRAVDALGIAGEHSNAALYAPDGDPPEAPDDHRHPHIHTPPPPLKRAPASAFVPIVATPTPLPLLHPHPHPGVTRPVAVSSFFRGSDDSGGGGGGERRKVHPLLKRILNRTSSASKVSEEAPVRRRRRSISLDTYGRNASPMAAPAAVVSRRSFALEVDSRTRTVDAEGEELAAPVALRSRTSSGGARLFSAAPSEMDVVHSDEPRTASATNSDNDTDSELSIDPALAVAAVASMGRSPFDDDDDEDRTPTPTPVDDDDAEDLKGADEADASIDTVSEKELSLSAANSAFSSKLRALSDGAALTARARPKRPDTPANPQRDDERRRPRPPPAGPRAKSPFPTSSASASVDSTDRAAAAEALARRTAGAGAGAVAVVRRSISMDNHQMRAHTAGAPQHVGGDVGGLRLSISRRRESTVGGAGAGAATLARRKDTMKGAGVTLRKWIRRSAGSTTASASVAESTLDDEDGASVRRTGSMHVDAAGAGVGVGVGIGRRVSIAGKGSWRESTESTSQGPLGGGGGSSTTTGGPTLRRPKLGTLFRRKRAVGERT